MHTRNSYIVITSIILLGILCSSCASEPEVVVVEAPDVVVEAPTETVVPAPTQKPTSTTPPEPTPTPTLKPTFSPETITISSGEPIHIAYLLMDADPIGMDQVRGIEIAIAEFGGEILGHSIKLTGVNSECNEFAAQQGSQLLMQDKSIIGVFGTTCSIPALKAAPIISENNRVLISSSNTSPELTDTETHSVGYARTAPNDLDQIKAVAHHAYDTLGAQKMAIVRGEINPYQRLYAASLCEYFGDLGGECVVEFAKFAGNTYVAPIITDLVEAEADAIYFLGWDFEEAAAFLEGVKGSEELQDTAVYLWGQVYSSPELLEEAGGAVIDVYVSATSYDYDTGSDQYQVFINTYRDDYGEDPINIFHPYAYDSAMLMLKAIAEVAVPADDGSMMVDPLAVRDAMYMKINFRGLSGYITCTPQGDCLSTSTGKVYQYVNGDPTTFNPGPADLLSSNPVQVWP